MSKKLFIIGNTFVAFFLSTLIGLTQTPKPLQVTANDNNNCGCDFLPMCDYTSKKNFGDQLFYGIDGSENRSTYFRCENGVLTKKWIESESYFAGTRYEWRNDIGAMGYVNYYDTRNSVHTMIILKYNVPEGTQWISNGLKFTIMKKNMEYAYDGKQYKNVLKVRAVSSTRMGVEEFLSQRFYDHIPVYANGEAIFTAEDQYYAKDIGNFHWEDAVNTIRNETTGKLGRELFFGSWYHSDFDNIFFTYKFYENGKLEYGAKGRTLENGYWCIESNSLFIKPFDERLAASKGKPISRINNSYTGMPSLLIAGLEYTTIEKKKPWGDLPAYGVSNVATIDRRDTSLIGKWHFTNRYDSSHTYEFIDNGSFIFSGTGNNREKGQWFTRGDTLFTSTFIMVYGVENIKNEKLLVGKINNSITGKPSLLINHNEFGTMDNKNPWKNIPAYGNANTAKEDLSFAGTIDKELVGVWRFDYGKGSLAIYTFKEDGTGLYELSYSNGKTIDYQTKFEWRYSGTVMNRRNNCADKQKCIVPPLTIEKIGTAGNIKGIKIDEGPSNVHVYERK